MRTGKDDPEFIEIAKECAEKSRQLFLRVVEQEKEWCRYLFKDGSMIGLNEEILCQYVEYIANQRMKSLDMEIEFKNALSNPIPWINAWLVSDNVQVAPQEVEVSSYLVGQIDSTVDTKELKDFEL